MIRRGLSVLVGLLCLDGVATAQPADEARARFQRGTELFDEGNYEAALVEFQASFGMRPVPVALFNVAQTLKLLFRYDEAIAAYRRYLQEGANDLDAARVAEVTTTIQRLESSIGTVTIECAPAGATVKVDGRPAGTTPLPGPLRLAAGRRRLEVSHPTSLTFREEVVVQGGESTRVCAELAAVTPQAVGDAAGADVERGEVTWSPDRADPIDRPAQGRSVFGQWWFWTAVGAVAIGAAVTTFVLTRPGDPEPIPGNVDPNTVTAAW